MKKWDYGGAIDRWPISTGQIWRTENDSAVCVADITESLPDIMREADMIFVDPPWNIGNLNSFITKADRTDYRDDFHAFLGCLFDRIGEIAPSVCYVEMGKEYLADVIVMMRRVYPKVTFYNSSYYHKRENMCYVVRGARKARKVDYDYLDEETIIERVCTEEDYTVIGDLCMGRGLVGINAQRNGKRFVGCDINPKRLAVLIEKTAKVGAIWTAAK